jgi:hypothetical protein
MTTPLHGIHVAYRLPEYLSTVLEYAPYAITGKKRGVSPNSVVAPTEQISQLARVTIKAVSSIAFLYKVSRVGDCIFAFDTEGLSRQSKMGELTVPWTKVERVFRLSQAYLFSKERGAMPVPYRCLSPEERASLEELLLSVGHGAKNVA